MEKINNIYCWNHLKDWAEAQNKGLVHVIGTKQKGEGLFCWEQLIYMAQEDCFPQSLLCFRQGNDNYLILTKEQEMVFNFLRNEVLMRKKEGVAYLFSDFSTEFRNKILNAQVDSIWIKLEKIESVYNPTMRKSQV